MNPTRSAAITPVLLPQLRVAIFAKVDDGPTGCAPRGLEPGGVLQLLEVVLVRPKVHVEFGLELLAADRACLPGTRVLLGMVKPTERVAPMVPVAAVPGMSEENVPVLVVTDPVATAFGARESIRFAA
jgi:hypothetical protein